MKTEDSMSYCKKHVLKKTIAHGLSSICLSAAVACTGVEDRALGAGGLCKACLNAELTAEAELGSSAP